MNFDHTRSAGYLANHMARLFFQDLATAVKPLGLAPAQFMTLLELWKEDGRTQKDLVQCLDVEQATLANTLARMERDGLVMRKPHPKDRRAQSIWLTERARNLQEPATTAARSVNQSALSGLSEEEGKLFLDLMTKVIKQMRSAAPHN